MQQLANLIGGVFVLGLIAAVLILIVAGPAGTKAAARGALRLLGGGFVWALRFTVGGMLFVFFTVTDAVITLAQIAYQSATARPYLVGDSCAGFGQRLSDRLYKLLLARTS
jgi:hypothetical protein